MVGIEHASAAVIGIAWPTLNIKGTLHRLGTQRSNYNLTKNPAYDCNSISSTYIRMNSHICNWSPSFRVAIDWGLTDSATRTLAATGRSKKNGHVPRPGRN